MKKLLYITNGICGSGGLERVLSVKTAVLAEEYGYDVHIISLNEPLDQKPFFNFSEKIIRHRVEVSGSPFMYALKYISGLKKTVQHVAPDVIMVCDDGLKGFFLPLLLSPTIPKIYERHVSKSIEEAENPSVITRITVKLKYFFMNILGAQFSKFVLLTHGNTKEWHLKNLAVIPNPLPFYPENPSDLTSKQVIAVGKQSHQKSYDRLLKIWALLPAEYADWTLHIYGKADHSHQLDQLAENLGVKDRVFFHDPNQNIMEKYLQSTVFVLSSRYEGFGMVLIEAMSCGLPVISFDCRYGPSDIIKNGEDGFLIRNGDLEQFSAKLQELMHSETLRKKMGSSGRQNVRRFLPHYIAKEWNNLFKSLVQ